MNVMANGLNFRGEPLFASRDEEEFIQDLQDSLPRAVTTILPFSRVAADRGFYRDEIRRKTLDVNNPVDVGWTYLIQQDDPEKAEIARILAPLARLRGMREPEQPLTYRESDADSALEWIADNYSRPVFENKKVPYYVLIVGGPERIPLQFQSTLDSVACVGRVNFASLGDLEAYVQKVIRLETSAKPVTEKEVVLFAPDAGQPDPTYYSLRYMARPLNDHICDKLSFPVIPLFGEDATKQNLERSLSTQKPALVYTAGHGLGAIGESDQMQQRYNGAICCQHSGGLSKKTMFSADDVPLNQSFLEGAAFFQFACFGYGTPAVSDFSHWMSPKGLPKKYTDHDFLAALPRTLLAHPLGPIAYFGHLDAAWLHGFADPDSPDTMERYHARLAPFVDAVSRVLSVCPVGKALEMLNEKFTICNAMITSDYDRIRRGKLTWTKELSRAFVDTWITWNDAQNYMLFGDPGTRVRIAC